MRRKEFDAAVIMSKIVPLYEGLAPPASLLESWESIGQEIRPILKGLKETLGIGGIIADMRTAERRLYA